MNKYGKKILNYFFQGLLYFAPIFITFYIIYSLFTGLDKSFKTLLGIDIPGLGIIIVFFLIAILGWLGKIFITEPFKKQFLKLLDKTPLIKVLYNSIQDLLKAFVGKEKKFDKPVLVKVNHISNLEKIGFITQDDLAELGIGDDKVIVYFPHSYAFSGEMFVVPKTDIKPINKKSAEVMKFIISAGVSKS